MLGIQISESTVAKYMIRHRNPPSQTWRTFLDNHVADLVSVDFFTVSKYEQRIQKKASPYAIPKILGKATDWSNERN